MLTTLAYFPYAFVFPFEHSFLLSEKLFNTQHQHFLRYNTTTPPFLLHPPKTLSLISIHFHSSWLSSSTSHHSEFHDQKSLVAASWWESEERKKKKRSFLCVVCWLLLDPSHFFAVRSCVNSNTFSCLVLLVILCSFILSLLIIFLEC